MTFSDSTGRSGGETSENGGRAPDFGAEPAHEPGLDAKLAQLAAQSGLELSRPEDNATTPLAADRGEGWPATEAGAVAPHPSTVAPGALETAVDQEGRPEPQVPVLPAVFGQTMVRGAAVGQPETADDSKSGSGSGEELLRADANDSWSQNQSPDNAHDGRELTPGTSTESTATELGPDPTAAIPLVPASFLEIHRLSAGQSATTSPDSTPDQPHPGTMEARDTTGGDDPSTDGPDNPDNSSGTTDPASGGSSSELVRKNSGDNPTPSPQAGGTGAGQGNGEDVGGTGGDSGDGGGGDDDSGGGSGDIGDDGHGDRGEDEGGGDALSEFRRALGDDADFSNELARWLDTGESLGHETPDFLRDATRIEAKRVFDVVAENLFPYGEDNFVKTCRTMSRGLVYLSELAVRQEDLRAIRAYQTGLEGLEQFLGAYLGTPADERWTLGLTGPLSRLYFAGLRLHDDASQHKLHGLLTSEASTAEALLVNQPDFEADNPGVRAGLQAIVQYLETSEERPTLGGIAELYINTYVAEEYQAGIENAHLMRLVRLGDARAREVLTRRLEIVIDETNRCPDAYVRANAGPVLEVAGTGEIRGRLLARLERAALPATEDMLIYLIQIGIFVLEHPAEELLIQHAHVYRMSAAIEEVARGLRDVGVHEEEIATLVLPWRTRFGAYIGRAPSDASEDTAARQLQEATTIEAAEEPERNIEVAHDEQLRAMAVEYVRSHRPERLPYARRAIAMIWDSQAALAAYVDCWMMARTYDELANLGPRLVGHPDDERILQFQPDIAGIFEAAIALLPETQDIDTIITSAIQIATDMRQSDSIQSIQERDDYPELGSHPYWELVTALTDKVQAIAPEQSPRLARALFSALLGSPLVYHPTAEAMDSIYQQLVRNADPADIQRILEATITVNYRGENPDPDSVPESIAIDPYDADRVRCLAMLALLFDELDTQET